MTNTENRCIIQRKKSRGGEDNGDHETGNGGGTQTGRAGSDRKHRPRSTSGSGGPAGSQGSARGETGSHGRSQGRRPRRETGSTGRSRGSRTGGGESSQGGPTGKGQSLRRTGSGRSSRDRSSLGGSQGDQGQRTGRSGGSDPGKTRRSQGESGGELGQPAEPRPRRERTPDRLGPGRPEPKGNKHPPETGQPLPHYFIDGLRRRPSQLRQLPGRSLRHRPSKTNQARAFSRVKDEVYTPGHYCIR